MSHLSSPVAFGQALTDSLVIYLDLDQTGLGPTPPGVGIAVQRLLEMTGSDSTIPINAGGEFDIYARARISFEQFRRDDPTGRTASIFVTYVSTFFHEARHVHDLLSTGFGLDLLAAQLNYYQNALPLAASLHRWQKDTHRLVPMPITTNHPAIQSDPNRVRVIERYSSFDSRVEPAGAPDSGIYSWMSNIHLLEASAGVVQLDITHDLFGDEGVLLFDELVRRGPNARKYMWLINDFVELVGRRSKVRKNVGLMMSFLLWTALQGTRSASSEAALSPVALFHALADFVSRHAEDVIDVARMRLLLDDFCRLWRLPLPATTLIANQKRVEAMADRFVHGWQAISADAPAHFADIFAGFRDAHLQLTNQIHAMPEIYFVGRFYSHALLTGHLPALRIDLKFNGIVETKFTPGRPCINPATWDKAAFYSAVLSLLIKGRCKFTIPNLEEQAFEFLTDKVGLRFEDALFG